MDHLTAWTLPGFGAACLLSAPYGMFYNGEEQLAAIKANPRFVVCEFPESWYGHGTRSIEVWNARAYVYAFIRAHT